MLVVTAPRATAQRPAIPHIDRGYALLVQAYQVREPEERERLVHSASQAFSQAYQLAGQSTKVEVLLGATQAYLAMQRPPKAFPFLWSAPPLQRAERSVRQALTLQADNSAAALLLGMVLWRQAQGTPTRQTALLQQSRRYLTQAAAGGIPVQLPGDVPPASGSHFPLFSMQDALRTLRYIDTRNTGRNEDLLLCYRLHTQHQDSYGVVIVAGQAYPLSSPMATATIPPADEVEACQVEPRPPGRPMITAIIRHQRRQIHRVFRWDGTQFAFVGEHTAPLAMPENK